MDTRLHTLCLGCLHPQRSGTFQAGHLMCIVPMFASPAVDTRRSLQCFASPAVDTGRSFAQAAQSRRTYNGICHFFSRDRAAQHHCHHPCWEAAYFLPCTRPPDAQSSARANPLRPLSTLRIRGPAVWTSNDADWRARRCYGPSCRH